MCSNNKKRVDVSPNKQSSGFAKEEQSVKNNSDLTVNDKSVLNTPSAYLEKIYAPRRIASGEQSTQTPTVTPTEVNSLGGVTAVDRKNKKGVASTVTSNTILGSSKGG